MTIKTPLTGSGAGGLNLRIGRKRTIRAALCG